MDNRHTILYGQIPDYGKVFRKNIEIQSFHDTIISSLSEKYQGEIKISSEGICKISFIKSENAIQFALSIMNRFHQSPNTPFKIGIAYFNQNKRNEELATYLSDACPVSAVLVSKEIVEILRNDSDFNFIKVGSAFFKEITETTEIYALSESCLYIPTQNDLAHGEKNKNSIAVLPFHNTSSEKELDYICDGISEEIIDSLSQVKGIFVTARSSSFMFKNKEISIQEISQKLNVNFVLDGSIRKRNNEYRISFQLVDCSDGYNIVSESFSSDFDSLYHSEKKITQKIITHFDPNENLSKDTDDFYINPIAYSYYLKGKYLLNQWNKNDSYKAIDHFNKALEIVPGYALAYAGLSSAHARIAINGFADFNPHIEKAVEYAQLSIEADSSTSVGYVAKAIATFLLGNLNLPDLEKNITTALTISPCNAEIRMYNGMVFLFNGDLIRALSELKLAKQLDPFSKTINLRLGKIQYLIKEYQEAHNTFLSQLKEDTFKTNYLFQLAWCCFFLKKYNKALEYLSKVSKEDAYYGIVYACYLVIYKNLKNEDKIYKYKSIIENQEKTDPSYAYNHAVLNNLLGNKELAIHFLEIELQNPLTILKFFQYDAFWEELHDYPPFVKLIESKYNTKGSQLMRIHSETKEYIELKDYDFIYAEAQNNYTLITYKEKNRFSKKMLRAKLSSIECQIKTENIIRCHRSFLVNCDVGFKYIKKDHKAYLQHPELEIQIPVSRSKEKELKDLFK